MAAIVLLVLAGFVLWVDLPTIVWIKENTSPKMYAVFEQVGRIGDSPIYPIVALLLYAFALVSRKQAWSWPVRISQECVARASLLLVVTMAVGGLITLLLKRGVARARPEVFFEQGFYGLGTPFLSKSPFNSFPSSHTLTAFAVAAVIGILAPRWRWPAFAVAAVVALSRLVNLDHYPSDVLAAAFIAIVTAYVAAAFILNKHYQWPLRAPWRWWARSP